MALPSKLQYAKSKDTKEYPLPSFFFVVSFGESKGIENKASFTEVSGLTTEVQTVDYRDGLDKNTVPRKIPGMMKYSNVTLKRGVFHKSDEFYKWISEKKYNSIERKALVITLQGSDNQPLITWSLSNAYPVKVDGPSMKSDSSEVAVETIELVHEGITVKHEN